MKITSSSSSKIAVPQSAVYPLLPLRDTVIFPHMVIPFFVGRPRSINAIEDAMNGNKLIFLAAQRKIRVENPKKEDIFSVGVIAEILQLLKLPDGNIKILVEGIVRGRINTYQNNDMFYKVDVEKMDEKVAQNADTEARIRSVLTDFENYIKLNRKIPPETMVSVINIDDPSRLADAIAAQMQLSIKEKQVILSLVNPLKRLDKLSKILTKEIEILSIEKNIHDRVRNQMEKTQREYYLNEQMKAIKKELGQKGDMLDEVEQLRKDLKAVKMPKEAWEKCDRELSRLEKMPPMSAESGVIRTYLEWFRDLPWNKKTRDKKDIQKAETILNEDHYGLEKVKERILEYIAVRQLTKKPSAQILCFVGPPGVGKTSLARSIARSLGRRFVRIALGGVRDEAEIRGHRRTYVGALPGRIIQTMKKAESLNPVFLLDEIDKMSTDFRGDPSSALLEVLDPEQNNTFSDHYMEVAFDLSDVFFITTANYKNNIPRPLLDRMEVIDLGGYTEWEKLNIAKLFLVPKQKELNGLMNNKVRITDEGIMEIIRYYTREAGVRNLEREIGTVYRKIAKYVVENKNKKLKNITIDKKDISSYLKVRRYKYGAAEKDNRVGVATGLAWTEAGGDVMPIEISILRGRGKLMLTGKLGEIMQESAQTAVSFARSKIDEIKMPKDFWKTMDIHIHVPEGAVPKEGPSAGITIATALISALTGIPIRKDIAMTGEITLRGNVLPIGGVKEKVLSAHRSLIKEVILPKENEKNYEDIPKDIRKMMKIYYVSTMEEVLKYAFIKPVARIKKGSGKKTKKTLNNKKSTTTTSSYHSSVQAQV